jgi:hypothetical protein
MFIEKNIRPHDFRRGGPKWVILLGLKGTSYTEVGYIFAPYLPLISTHIISEETFINTLSITSRYARAINNGYYSTTTLL